MNLLRLVFYPAGIGICCLIAFQKTRTKEVKYGLFDRISQITNVLLFCVYGYASISPMSLGMRIQPNSGATIVQSFLAYVLSWIVSGAPIYALAFIGMSVDYRRRNHEFKGFFVQFLGVLGIYFPMRFFQLVEEWNLPWILISSK